MKTGHKRGSLIILTHKIKG